MHVDRCIQVASCPDFNGCVVYNVVNSYGSWFGWRKNESIVGDLGRGGRAKPAGRGSETSFALAELGLIRTWQQHIEDQNSHSEVQEGEL